MIAALGSIILSQRLKLPPGILEVREDSCVANARSFPLPTLSITDYLSTLSQDAKFGIVFIDGDHRLEHLIRDYHAVLPYLHRRGLLFIHDLYPPNQRCAGYGYCADGYRFLHAIRMLNTFPHYTMVAEPPFFGLTVLKNPVPVVVSPSSSRLSYEEFLISYSADMLLTENQMQLQLSQMV